MAGDPIHANDYPSSSQFGEVSDFYNAEFKRITNSFERLNETIADGLEIDESFPESFLVLERIRNCIPSLTQIISHYRILIESNQFNIELPDFKLYNIGGHTIACLYQGQFETLLENGIVKDLSEDDLENLSIKKEDYENFQYFIQLIEDLEVKVKIEENKLNL